MDDPIKAVYAKYEEKLQQQLAEVKKTKEFLNSLAREMGNSIPFPDLAGEDFLPGMARIRKGQFFNKRLATAVKEYLQLRKEAASWDEIVEALRRGGYEIGRGKAAENKARLTILKNTANFVLIGDNDFGLKEWYPKLRKNEEKEEPGEEEAVPKKRPGRPKKTLDVGNLKESPESNE